LCSALQSMFPDHMVLVVSLLVTTTKEIDSELGDDFSSVVMDPRHVTAMGLRGPQEYAVHVRSGFGWLLDEAIETESLKVALQSAIHIVEKGVSVLGLPGIPAVGSIGSQAGPLQRPVTSSSGSSPARTAEKQSDEWSASDDEDEGEEASAGGGGGVASPLLTNSRGSTALLKRTDVGNEELPLSGLLGSSSSSTTRGDAPTSRASSAGVVTRRQAAQRRSRGALEERPRKRPRLTKSDL